jgi:hypothetical protein
MCWLACLPRRVSTFLARPCSCSALPKKKSCCRTASRLPGNAVAGETEEAGHDLVHAAVLAGDVAVPHADARLGRQRLQPGMDPEPMPLATRAPFRCRRPRSSRAGRRGSCAACSTAPRSGCPAAVGGALFEHDELVRRIGADEADAPVPVVGADAAGAQVGVVAGLRPARAARPSDRRRTGRLPGRPARLLRQVVERVDQVVHLLQEVRPQRLVVGRARIRLRDGRQVVTARVAAQPRRLVVPTFERRAPSGCGCPNASRKL